MTANLFLKLNAESLRHSQILHLKKLLRSNSGNIPLTLEFLSGDRPIGKIVIESRWGVSLERNLEQDLRNLPYVIGLQVQA